MTVADFKKAREAIEAEGLWMAEDPAFAVVLRFPGATPEQLATLIADCDEKLVAELGQADEPKPIEAPAIDAAKERAEQLLLETKHFEELGLGTLASTARALARELVETVEMLEAERSGRKAAQANYERVLEILSNGAGAAAANAIEAARGR